MADEVEHARTARTESVRAAQTAGAMDMARQLPLMRMQALGAAFPLPTARPYRGRLRLCWLARCTSGQLTTWGWIEREVVYPWWRQLKRYLPDVLDKMNVAPGFHMLPRRCGWVAERTFAWLGRSRRLRLSRDDERLPASNEAIVYVTSMRLLLVRLA